MWEKPNHCYNAYVELINPPTRAPELPSSPWINTYETISLSNLTGKVLLLNFWDFTCLNCIRTLPYLRTWQHRYFEHFTILGIHTPKFSFSGDVSLLKSMIGRLGISWPVIIDADQKIWEAYGTRCWPTMNLIDKLGRIRFRHEGEGKYIEIERAIQSLIHEIDPSIQMEEPHNPLREEDRPDAPCIQRTTELHTDSIEKYDALSHEPTPMQLPSEYSINKIYLQGDWVQEHDGVMLVSAEGTISLQYRGARCYAILSPSPSTISHVHYERDPVKISVKQDENPLSPECFGEDIQMIDETSYLLIDMPRLYHLVQNPSVDDSTITLHLKTPGITFYAFSFVSNISEDVNLRLAVKE